MFALVMMVDETLDGVPRGVKLFETEDQAVAYAVSLLSSLDAGISRVQGTGQWAVEEDGEIVGVFSTDEDLLDWFQGCLESIEYFHVFPVIADGDGGKHVG